jgi:hypothetical protein
VIQAALLRPEPYSPSLDHPGGALSRPADPAESGDVVVGLVVSPGPATHLATGLMPDLSIRIADQLPAARWTARMVSDRLADGPADLSQLISAARRRLLADGWHLAVCITDLPLQTARRPVVAHASATHGVAVLSLPALGAVAVGRRAAEAIVRLVAALVGDADSAEARGGSEQRRRAGVTRRVRELGGRQQHDEHGVGLVAGVVTEAGRRAVRLTVQPGLGRGPP